MLALLDISELNEIQIATLQAAEAYSNIVLLAATGSGKTLAYLLPLLKKIEKKAACTQAVVVVPTRELALQVANVLGKMKTGLKMLACYGGHDIVSEYNSLTEAPVIIIGTPGRLIDHMHNGRIDVQNIHSLVMDEFDKLLDLGFEEQLEAIIEELPQIRNKMLVSATALSKWPHFLSDINLYTLDFLDTQAKVNQQIKLCYLKASGSDKKHLLLNLLCQIGEQQSIVFCNHREDVESVYEFLTEKGLVCSFYHGGLDQHFRESAISRFINGSAHTLISTDLAGRGLDIQGLPYVIHYHFAGTEEIFIHRSGRTARQNEEGTVIFLLRDNEYLPAYAKQAEEMTLSKDLKIPDLPRWITLSIDGGKKDKLNKVDILGFLIQKGQMKKESVGIIDVKDRISYVAVDRLESKGLMSRIKDEKIKKLNVRFRFLNG